MVGLSPESAGTACVGFGFALACLFQGVLQSRPGKLRRPLQCGLVLLGESTAWQPRDK